MDDKGGKGRFNPHFNWRIYDFKSGEILFQYSNLNTIAELLTHVSRCIGMLVKEKSENDDEDCDDSSSYYSDDSKSDYENN